jgi:putative copper resistance protein D
MIWLIQDFSLFSVVLRAMLLTVQTLTVGGVLYFALIVSRGTDSLTVHQNIRARCLRWIARFATALALAGALYVAIDSTILMVSMGMPLTGLLGADYFVAGTLTVLLSAALAAWAHKAAGAQQTTAYMPLLIAAALMLVSVFTSHAVSRLHHRLLLSVLTLLHQGAAAAWMGGLAFLLISLRTAGLDMAEARRLLQRFSTLATAGLLTVAISGVLLAVFYVASVPALYGTAYGVMVVFKGMLLVLLVLLGAVNFSAGRDGDLANSTIALLRRRSEVELAIFFAVIITAASLTSQSPGVDLVEGRLTSHELIEHFRPAEPRLHHPPLEALAPATPLEESVRNPDDLERAAAHTNRDPDLNWSEFEHNWAGIFMISIGIGAFISAFAWGRWARYWPMLFLGLAGFLMVFSDPENWPLGPISYWKSFSDPEVLLHRFFFSLLIVFGIFETGIQTRRLRSRGAALVFPTMVATGAVGLLLHSHTLGNVKLELLAEISHTTIGILAILSASVRWFQIWLWDDLDRNSDPPSSTVTRALNIAAFVWPLCLLLIGIVLLNYREG